MVMFEAGADLGGGGRGGGRTPPLGIRPPADPKGPTFDTSYVEGERAPKKKTHFFLSKFFKKCPKTAFLTVFSKICLRRRKFCQNRGRTVLWESSKNQFGRSKKRSSNFGKFFSKLPPLRENPRSAPECSYQ